MTRCGFDAWAVFSLVLAMASNAWSAVPTEQQYWVEQLRTGFHYPWSIAWLPSGEALITERFGKIHILRGDRTIGEVRGVPNVLTAGPWDGLFDIEVDPDFPQNHLIYLTLTGGTRDARLGKVFRAELEGAELRNGKTIFTTTPPISTIGPIMMRILFLPDRTMLVGVGAADFNPDLAQDLTSHIGKVIRMNRDGSPPADNPFRAVAGARPEIWATGLRNPSGLARTDDGRVWAVDIGPKGGDELNEIKLGGNYGWPLVSWGFDYSGQPVSHRQERSDFVSPVLVWSPSHTPSDLVQLHGNAYPFWEGDLFTGGLSGLSARRLRLRDGHVAVQEQMLLELNERIRCTQIGPDGLLYMLTDGDSGRLLRLRPGFPNNGELTSVAKPAAYANSQGSMLNRERIYRRESFVEVALRHPPNPYKGQEHFEQMCSGCHTFERFTAGKVGPDLNGLTGRSSGQQSDFSYSAALSDPERRVVWDRETLLNFLADPQGLFPGTKMALSPMTDSSVAAWVVDYLLSEEGPAALTPRKTH